MNTIRNEKFLHHVYDCCNHCTVTFKNIFWAEFKNDFTKTHSFILAKIRNVYS